MPSVAHHAAMPAFGTARATLLDFLADIPDDKATHQLFDGANHPAWIVGHLTWANRSILSALTGEADELADSWMAEYGFGSKPRSDASTYPPLSELRQLFEASCDAFVKWSEGLSDEQAAAATPEAIQDFVKVNGAALPQLAWHIGLHAGQLTMVRRSLGHAWKF